MGAELSLLQSAPQTTGDVLRDLSAEFPDFVPQSVLGNFKIFKVLHCVHDQFRACVVKFIFGTDALSLSTYVHKVLEIRSRFIGPLHGNVVPYEFAEASNQAAIMVRPFFPISLFDRLYAAPHLTLAEKKFLALQMLCAVLQLHSVQMAHGNLKLDNFFVTGNLTVYLTDQGIFKPVEFPGDDPVALYSLFHEGDLKRRKCFVAPERFVDNPVSSLSFFDTQPLNAQVAKMDAFGLGCSLAELFLDGPHIADLPELLLFRSGGDFDPAATLDKLGTDQPEIKRLIKALLVRDPVDRCTVAEALNRFTSSEGDSAPICPPSFSQLLFPIYTVASTVHLYQNPDARMALLRANVASFVPSGAVAISELDEFTEAEIFNCKNFRHPRITQSSGKLFFERLVRFWTEGAVGGTLVAASEIFAALTTAPVEETSSCDPDTLGIFVALVCSTGAACAYSRSKRVYLEILLAAVAHVPETTLSEVVIPYAQEFVASETAHAGLRAKALEVLGCAVRLLKRSETGLFSDFIFPALLQGDPVQNFPCALTVAVEAVRLAALTGEEFDKKFSVIRMFVERAFLRVSLNKQTAKQMMIDQMDTLLKFVDEKTVFSVLGGFFTDAQWQVRSDACRKLTRIAKTNQSREKIIFPGVMSCLYDADERVIVSALRGIGNLIPSVSTKLRIQVAEKIFPLLHHPAKHIVGAEAELLLTEGIARHISQVDQLIFLRHWLLPDRCLDELGASASRKDADMSLPYDLLEQLAYKENALQSSASAILAGVPFEFRRQTDKLRPFIAAYARGMLSRARDEGVSGTGEIQQFAAGHNVQVQTLNSAIGGLRDFRFLAELESHMRPSRLRTAESRDRRTDALCLPASPLELGTLSQLDGSYLNFYDPRNAVANDTDFMQTSTGSGVSLQRDHIAIAYPGTALPPAAAGRPQNGRIPEGTLLASLYELSGERIVGVDCTDDGRILAVAGEKRILCYRLGNLDREAYLSASKELSVPATIRKMRMARNSKSVVVAHSDRVEIFRLDVRADQPLAAVHIGESVVDICQFDAAFESCIFALTRTGKLIGWDYRSKNPMSRLKLPTLALPSGLVLSRDGISAAVGYFSGKLSTIDLRKNIVSKTFRCTGIQAMAASATSGHLWLSTVTGDVCEFNVETGGAPKSHYLISDTVESHAPIKIPHLVFTDDSFLAAHAEFEDSIVPETLFGCRAMRATSMGLFTAHNDAVVRLWQSDAVSTIPRLHSESPVSVNSVGNVKVVAQQPPKDLLLAREAHRDGIVDFCIASLQTDLIITAARDGLVKIWK